MRNTMNTVVKKSYIEKHDEIFFMDNLSNIFTHVGSKIARYTPTSFKHSTVNQNNWATIAKHKRSEYVEVNHFTRQNIQLYILYIF